MNKSYLPSLRLKSFNFFLLIFSFCFLFLNDACAGKNKQTFILKESNFSQEETIDFHGIYETIHYEFTDESLLLDALYPLLPSSLQQNRLKFPQLEFIGDAVLALSIRERVISLFPHVAKKVQVRLYDSLVCNRNLTQVFLDKLRIEKYLPFPGGKTCQYCDVVEALIGAIYQDNQQDAQAFVEWLMGDDYIIERYADLFKREVNSIDKGEFKKKVGSRKRIRNLQIDNTSTTNKRFRLVQGYR